MNRIYRVIWNCTLQVFQACSELTRRAGKTSTVNLRKSSGLTTKFSRLTLSGYSAGLYATWYQNDANKTGAYVDSWALYNWFDNSVSSDNRSADDYDSRGVTASGDARSQPKR